jgi:parallel beta-helix repeat protein
MQPPKNKAFPLIYSIIRLSLQIGAILAIILISILILRQTPNTAINLADMGAIPYAKSSDSTLQVQGSLANQSTESLPTASPLQKIYFPLIVDMFIGTTYYVSPTGNDSNPGTLTQPFRTIQKGVNKLAAGDTLYIRGGTYTEKIQINVSGSPSQHITISSYPGETAIMDGNGLDPTLPAYTRLIELNGSYVLIENLELTYPKGRGIVLWKDANTDSSYNIIRNLNVHNTWGVGIQVLGDNNLIENSTITKADLANADSNRDPVNWIDGYGISIGDSGHAYYGMNTIVRNNKVYDTYGEGIICMYTDNALIEDNLAFDNWAENIYLDTCSYITVRNNLIYYTTNHEYWRFTNAPAAGIEFSNEGINSHPIGHDLQIYNNIIINAISGIYFWTGWASGSASINNTIAYNTIVINSAYAAVYGILIEAPKNTVHSNTVIENNLVLIANLGHPMYFATTTGLTYSHNLWSQTPYNIGTGDIVGNPLLNDPTHNVDFSIDPSWYKLTSLSPAIGKALTMPGILTDYFWVTREPSPDIGAIESR